MDPPSTPAPLALRGRTLDDALRVVEPARPVVSDDQPAPATDRDPRLALAAAERFLEEQRAAERGRRDAAGSNGPLTMRGDALAIALEMARSSRVRVKH